MDSLDGIESQFSSITPRITVEFQDTQNQYDINVDVFCAYDLGGYRAQEGDRIAIYKLGWLYVKEYVLFEWVPIGDQDIVVFNKNTLPRNQNDLYQFCYVSGDNEIFGASTPFQFINLIRDYSEIRENSVLKSHVSMNSYKSDDSSSSKDSQKEIYKLKEENEILKESIKMFMAHNNPRNQNKDMQELKTLVYSLRDVVKGQENDLKLLKNQVKVALECNRNLIQEKADVERKYQVLKTKTNIPVVQVTKALRDINVGEIDYNFGELETIPPFPFPK